MEGLHLSYEEVVHIVPYRNLLLMTKDKLHVAYGEVMKEVSAEEFFGGRLPSGAVGKKK